MQHDAGRVGGVLRQGEKAALRQEPGMVGVRGDGALAEDEADIAVDHVEGLHRAARRGEVADVAQIERVPMVAVGQDAVGRGQDQASALDDERQRPVDEAGGIADMLDDLADDDGVVGRRRRVVDEALLDKRDAFADRLGLGGDEGPGEGDGAGIGVDPVGAEALAGEQDREDPLAGADIEHRRAPHRGGEPVDAVPHPLDGARAAPFAEIGLGDAVAGKAELRPSGDLPEVGGDAAGDDRPLHRRSSGRNGSPAAA